MNLHQPSFQVLFKALEWVSSTFQADSILKEFTSILFKALEWVSSTFQADSTFRVLKADSIIKYFLCLYKPCVTYCSTLASLDQPRRAVAVALIPPRLNSSPLSLSWKSWDPLLFNLFKKNQFMQDINRGSYMSNHFIWNLLNKLLASLINFIWNDHLCKILFIIRPFKCDFIAFKVDFNENLHCYNGIRHDVTCSCPSVM